MNRIPGTEINVFPITLGTMTYGSPVAFDEAVKLTQYAVSCGINLIDTANMYEGYNRYAGSAGGVAEEIVGRALRGLPHSGIAVATKVGMKVGAAPEDEGTSPAAIRSSSTTACAGSAWTASTSTICTARTKASRRRISSARSATRSAPAKSGITA